MSSNFETYAVSRGGAGTRIRLAATTALLLAAAFVAGCNSQPPTDGKTHVGALVFQEDQYMRLVEFGIRDAAQKNDVQVSVNNTFNTLDKEISLIDTYLANRVNALVVAPLSSKSSIPGLRRAHEAGVVVVTFDTFIDADFPTSCILSDQVDLGRKSGEEAVKFINEKLGGKAKIALVTSVSVAPELGQQRVDGFRDAVTQLPGVEIVIQQDAYLAPEATVAVENMLTARPDINLVWAANEGGTVGAVTAVVSKGKSGSVFVFGTDMSEQIGSFLLASDDVLQAVTGQEPFEIGQRALSAAVDALAKKPVAKKVALPGILFSRHKPDQVKKYMEFLAGVSR